MRHELGEGRSYIVGDAIEVLQEYRDEAAAIFLDDAWARPNRYGHFGIDYDTHPFNEEQDAEGYVDTSITTCEIIDESHDALSEGGWLIADADDWLLPRLARYLQDEWGDVAESYEGGGYRKVGGVTITKADGTPDRSTAGMYLSTGGYPVVFAHKGDSDRQTSESARQIASNGLDDYGWGSVKPISPYKSWVKGLIDPGELILVPCAGTAPAALAAEQLFGDEAHYVCVDNDERAFEAFQRRRKEEVPDTHQKSL